jgi:hypothetical protein
MKPLKESAALWQSAMIDLYLDPFWHEEKLQRQAIL